MCARFTVLSDTPIAAAALALRRWYLPTKRSSQPPHLGFAAFGHLFAPNQMAQANHSSAGGNNKQFPSVSLKNTDSNRYGGGISFKNRGAHVTCPRARHRCAILRYSPVPSWSDIPTVEIHADSCMTG